MSSVLSLSSLLLIVQCTLSLSPSISSSVVTPVSCRLESDFGSSDWQVSHIGPIESAVFSPPPASTQDALPENVYVSTSKSLIASLSVTDGSTKWRRSLPSDSRVIRMQLSKSSDAQSQVLVTQTTPDGIVRLFDTQDGSLLFESHSYDSSMHFQKFNHLTDTLRNEAIEADWLLRKHDLPLSDVLVRSNGDLFLLHNSTLRLLQNSNGRSSTVWSIKLSLESSKSVDVSRAEWNAIMWLQGRLYAVGSTAVSNGRMLLIARIKISTSPESAEIDAVRRVEQLLDTTALTTRTLSIDRASGCICALSIQQQRLVFAYAHSIFASKKNKKNQAVVSSWQTVDLQAQITRPVHGIATLGRGLVQALHEASVDKEVIHVIRLAEASDAKTKQASPFALKLPLPPEGTVLRAIAWHNAREAPTAVVSLRHVVSTYNASLTAAENDASALHLARSYS